LNKLIRAAYKRLGIVQVGRRRVRDLIDFIENRKVDTVIDVGANIGQFGESLRANGFREKIVSFEPTSSAFQALAQKAAADRNWEAHHCAIGATSGTTVLHASHLSVFNSILELSSVAALHDSRMAVHHTEEVPIYPLDQILPACAETVLLKIDTQGYERQVIEGAKETVRRVAGILMELPVIHTYEGEWHLHEALQYMFEAGFVPAQIQAVAYHGADNVSAVDFDCLFRPRSQVDGVGQMLNLISEVEDVLPVIAH
jgi:FkbM family methyltransferase